MVNLRPGNKERIAMTPVDGLEPLGALSLSSQTTSSNTTQTLNSVVTVGNNMSENRVLKSRKISGEHMKPWSCKLLTSIENLDDNGRRAPTR